MPLQPKEDPVLIDRKVSPLEHKLLILYTIEQLGSVTNLQLLQFMVDNQLMDYMTLQLSLGEMMDAGQLEIIPHALGALYRLTQSGQSALAMFGKRVPYSRRQAAAQAAVAWKRRFELEQQLLSDFKKQADGQYLLSLSLLEKDSPLLLLKMTLPAWNMADLFASRWAREGQRIYSHILQTLSRDYSPQGRSLTQTGQIVGQAGSDPLLKLEYAPGQDVIFSLLLPVPPDEDLACHYTRQFQTDAHTLLNFITAQLAKA